VTSRNTELKILLIGVELREFEPLTPLRASSARPSP